MKDSNKIKEECMNDECEMNNMENVTTDDCINITLEELENDGLLPPSDFNSETEPLSLLDAIDKVNTMVERFVNINEVFDLSCCHGSDLDYLSKRLGIPPMEAFVFSVCVELGPSNITFGDISRVLGLSRARTMTLAPNLNSLVRNWMLSETRGYRNEVCYNVPSRVIDILTSDSDYESPKRTVEKGSELLGLFHDFVVSIENDTTAHRMILEETEALLNANKDLPLVQKITEYDLTIESEMLLLYFCDLAVNENDYQVTSFQIGHNLYRNPRNFARTRQELKSGRHELFNAELIEFGCDDGIADTSQFSLTSNAREALLAEFEIKQSEEKTKELLQSTSIEEKELFYSSRVGKQVDDLHHFLEPEKYNDIVTRMKKRFKRAGLTCLLYGGPGTGKTETVYQLARETGRDIMTVDVSQLKSKWVGDSEKNIKGLFDHYRKLVETSTVTPILLFNEADAIFGIRMAGAKRSVDKMENSMQNIILQEMETLNGILIATTNLTENLDAAFERRFLYKVRFERPDESVRARIWHQMLPELNEKECKTLGRDYDLSGGQIENVARKFAIDGILHGEDSADRLNLLHELCSSECINDKNTKARRVGFVA